MITRTNMSPFVAIAKVNEVAKLLRVAEAHTEQAAINECLISEARHFARTGQSIKAFKHLSFAKVKAGTVKRCCGLHSAQYGCGTHGYPRTK